jgi:hypothetical protein
VGRLSACGVVEFHLAVEFQRQKLRKRNQKVRTRLHTDHRELETFKLTPRAPISHELVSRSNLKVFRLLLHHDEFRIEQYAISINTTLCRTQGQ